MPDLDFKVTGVEGAVYGIVPLLHFKLEVTNVPETEIIQSVMLQTQGCGLIRMRTSDNSRAGPRRSYRYLAPTI